MNKNISRICDNFCVRKNRSGKCTIGATPTSLGCPKQIIPYHVTSANTRGGTCIVSGCESPVMDKTHATILSRGDVFCYDHATNGDLVQCAACGADIKIDCRIGSMIRNDVTPPQLLCDICWDIIRWVKFAETKWVWNPKPCNFCGRESSHYQLTIPISAGKNIMIEICPICCYKLRPDPFLNCNTRDRSGLVILDQNRSMYGYKSHDKRKPSFRSAEVITTLIPTIGGSLCSPTLKP